MTLWLARGGYKEGTDTWADNELGSWSNSGGARSPEYNAAPKGVQEVTDSMETLKEYGPPGAAILCYLFFTGDVEGASNLKICVEIDRSTQVVSKLNQLYQDCVDKWANGSPEMFEVWKLFNCDAYKMGPPLPPYCDDKDDKEIDIIL